MIGKASKSSRIGPQASYNYRLAMLKLWEGEEKVRRDGTPVLVQDFLLDRQILGLRTHTRQQRQRSIVRISIEVMLELGGLGTIGGQEPTK